MNLSPRQLRVFVSLAQSLSFSRTASLFFVSQPTLSKTVREIEEAMGVRLFERTTRSVSLTVDGAALLAVARRVVTEFDAGVIELEQVVRHRSHGLTIAALPSLAAMLLPDLIAELQNEVPDAIVRINDVIEEEALELLRSRRVDVALTSIDVIHKDLVYNELFGESFVLLAHRNSRHHPLPDMWSEEVIAALPIISMPRGTGTRKLVDEAFMRGKGIPFRPLFEFRDLNSIARFVTANCGIALIPRTAALLLNNEALVIGRLSSAPARTVGIVTRREYELPVLAARMIQSIQKQAAAMACPEQD